LSKFVAETAKTLPPLWLIYIGDVFMAILPVTVTRDCHYLLALATLGGATEIGSFLLMSRHPRRPWLESGDCCYRQHYRMTFANVKTALIV
jgi:hypothetical protein